MSAGYNLSQSFCRTSKRCKDEKMKEEEEEKEEIEEEGNQMSSLGAVIIASPLWRGDGAWRRE